MRSYLLLLASGSGGSGGAGGNGGRGGDMNAYNTTNVITIILNSDGQLVGQTGMFLCTPETSRSESAV